MVKNLRGMLTRVKLKQALLVGITLIAFAVVSHQCIALKKQKDIIYQDNVKLRGELIKVSNASNLRETDLVDQVTELQDQVSKLQKQNDSLKKLFGGPFTNFQ